MKTALRIYDETPGAERKQAFTLSLASERITARELIRRRVEQEVAEFNSATDEIFSGLVQPSESERLLNGYKLKKRRRLDPEKQVEAALEAFTSNGILLLFDDRQIEELEEEITVSPVSEAVFIRLLQLVGG